MPPSRDVLVLEQDLPVLMEHNLEVEPLRRVAQEENVPPLDDEPAAGRRSLQLGADACRIVNEQVVP